MGIHPQESVETSFSSVKGKPQHIGCQAPALALYCVHSMYVEPNKDSKWSLLFSDHCPSNPPVYIEGGDKEEHI